MKTKEINKLYTNILKHLTGEWLLVGGALLNILGISNRETIDIDLVPLGEVTNQDQIRIMEIAEQTGFPPETVNFSAEYYVKKIEYWKDEIILMFENDVLKIYRPTRKLFTALKKQRGTEIDILDIKAFESKIER